MSKPDIYRQHDAAFSSVSAFVILAGDNSRAATIAFKFPRDGAGRLYCYLHVFGVAMVRGFAAGGGYDKKTAAAAHAAEKLSTDGLHNYPETKAHIEAIRKALEKDGGYDWSRELENAGFKVMQAV
jgi:hypothetical protein